MRKSVLTMQGHAVIVDWAAAAAIFFATFVVCLVIRHLLFSPLRRQTGPHRSAAQILDETLSIPSYLWSLVIALGFTLQFAALPERAARWVSNGNVVFLVVSICVVLSSLLVRLGVFYTQSRGLEFGLSGVSRALIHVFVLLMGTMVLLRYFDVAITPMLTALGVGGLAVALALRDTLANFFAGIHILVEAPISIGDFIKLSSGEEGTVTDIGWRTTRVLTTVNNTVVIPNEKITSSILTNYAMPDRRLAITIELVTSFEADLDQVSRIAVEEARKVEAVVPDFQPVVLFDPGVLPTHFQFKLVVQIENRLQQGLVSSEIRRRILERFRQERIPLPALEHVAMFKN